MMQHTSCQPKLLQRQICLLTLPFLLTQQTNIRQLLQKFPLQLLTRFMIKLSTVQIILQSVLLQRSHRSLYQLFICFPSFLFTSFLLNSQVLRGFNSQLPRTVVLRAVSSSVFPTECGRGLFYYRILVTFFVIKIGKLFQIPDQGGCVLL